MDTRLNSGDSLFFSVRVIGLAFLLFCSGIGHAAELEKVTIQLKWLHQFQFAGFYAAKAKGFYAEEGLDIELRQRDPDSSHIEDVLHGMAEYGVADAGLLIERLQGKPVVLLSQFFQHSPLVFITLKSSGLREPKDLVNQRIMYDALGHSDMPLIALLLNSIGTLDSDKLQQVSFNLQDLTDGKTDVYAGYLTDQPFWFYERKIDINIINPRDYGIDYYGDNLFTTEKELAEHPDRVEKILRATLKGWKYALENKAEIIDLILTKYNTQGFSREHLEYEAEETEKLIVPDFVKIGNYDPSRFQNMINTYVRAGFVEQQALPAEFFYRSKIRYGQIGLSKEEQKWLAKHPVLRLGNSVAWPPIGFINEDGIYSGLAADYIGNIAQILGVKIEPAQFASWRETVNALRDGKIDMLDAASPTPQRREFFTFTKPYLSHSLVIVTGREVGFVANMAELDGKKVAVIAGSAAHDLLLKNHPRYHIYGVPNVKAGLMAAEKQGVAYIGDLATVSHAMGHEGFTNVKISGETPYLYNLSIAFNKDNAMLASIVQKALDAIQNQTRHAIHRKWLSVTFEHKIDYKLVWQIVVGFVVVFIVILYWNRRMAREVAQRRLAEQQLNQANNALLESESYLKFALKTARAGAFIFDYETNYLDWDAQSCEIFGIKPEEFCHNFNSWEKLIHPDELIGTHTIIEAQLEAGVQIDVQYSCLRPDGAVCHIWTVANILRDQSGKPLKLIGLHFDDTELILAQQALVRSKNEADMANQAKSEFLANMSHELRTPMHAILSFSELGTGKVESAPRQKLERYFSRIHESAERLMPLLNDLLDLSKLEGGNIEFNQQTGDLREIGSVIEQEFSGLLKDNGLTLDIPASDVNTIARFDSDKLLQVMRNLVSNAIKFSSRGKSIQVVYADSQLKDDTAVGDGGELPAIAVSVSDQGIGIPEQELELVFNKFIQSSKTKTGGGGTGLGLAICEQIISRHKGRIWAENNPEGGARFTFVIPR